MTCLPLTVTAHLAHGYATAHPWGIALDGLLAAQQWQTLVDQTPPGQVPWPSTTTDPPDLPLPLARCTPPGAPQLWHWAATCSQPVGSHHSEIHYRTHHLDHRPVEDLTGGTLPAALSSRSGPFRSRRMPLIITVCRSVSWSAVGDPDQVWALLAPIAAIGKKRGHGEGTVTRWHVAISERPRWDSAHLHPDGTLGRPSPAQCLPAQHRSHLAAPAGLRPPYMHPSRQADLHLPRTPDNPSSS